MGLSYNPFEQMGIILGLDNRSKRTYNNETMRKWL